MNEISVGEHGRLQILVMIDWYDGPREGIVKNKAGDACWYFKLFAKQKESATVEGQLFALWSIPERASSIMVHEYGGSEGGGVIWPPSVVLGSAEASGIVESLAADRQGPPDVVIHTTDLVEVLGVWDLVQD